MAVVTIPDENRELSNVDDIASFLEQHGLWYERWELHDLPPANAPAEVILERFKVEIERLNKRGGFKTADVINLRPDTPGLDSMLTKFAAEHRHTEDEVRFVLHGRGVFHINPENGPIFAVEMQSGDLINVPAGTRHWFNLCSDRTIVTIRLFQDTTGWAPHYVENARHLDYWPLCMGPKPLISAFAHDKE